MTDLQVWAMILGVILALVFGAAWVLRNDPRFNPPSDT